MISKNTLKFIKSLHQKKFRKTERSFFVEGAKNVTELLRSDFEVTHVLFTAKFAVENEVMLQGVSAEKYEVDEAALEAIGSYQSNTMALAVSKIRDNELIMPCPGELLLALDDVRDPGNLGTIIRIADWYGIRKLLLSPQSADFYNPKVLNASMGSFTRVSFAYVDLSEVLKDSQVPVYGAFLDGENIHQCVLNPEGVIVMGNESAGISPEVEKLVHRRLTIPSFGGAESLNVAIATAVICDNFSRFRS